MKVHDIAHSRSGDKGDYSIVMVAVYLMENYSILANALTAELVKDYYGELVKGSVTRYECPNVGMLIFEMEHALGGGITRTLRHDGHGKNMGNAILEIDIVP